MNIKKFRVLMVIMGAFFLGLVINQVSMQAATRTQGVDWAKFPIGTIAENVAVVQQSSGWNLYCLSWNPNGAVSAIKHNTSGTATAITTTTQLQVSADILLK
ncbi:hypothetical protein WP50_19595 [Lactiplantibacillus plantarum]|nr:hypothetical protein WP50_19595 [Lactiplantibacillus plantarum]